jgi:hypothetical protein
MRTPSLLPILLCTLSWPQAAQAEPGSESEPEPGPVTEPSSDTETVTGSESETGSGSDSESALSAADEAALLEALARDQAADSGSDSDSESDSEPGPAPAPRRRRASSALQSMNPDLSFIADFALAALSDEDRQLQTGAHDPRANGFNLQQLELSVGAAVDPYFRFDANIVYGQFGVEIEEAYGTTLDLPHGLQARAGQFLTRFGRINGSHPHTWFFADQPLAIGRLFGAEGNRGLGAELSWLSPLPWYVELIASSTMAAGEATARSFYGPNDQGVHGPADLQHTLVVEQFFPLGDDWSLAWGLSSAFGPNGTGRDNRTEIYGTDLYLKWRPITRQSVQIASLHSEWFVRRRQVPAAVLQDVSGFTQLFWRFALRWAVAARHDYGSPSYDGDLERRTDALDPDWRSHRHRFAANVTFWPSEFSRLRLQPSVDLPLWEEKPIYAVFLALELVTGAHGSHRF